ncbi:MAG: hypothetical protein QXE81_05455 [Desulfurococcaceae archaeon]
MVKVASVENAVIFIEKHPKRFQDRAIEKNKGKSMDAHGLKQSANRSLQKQVVEKELEHEVRVELVDPRNSSKNARYAAPACFQ